ncbi:hypothetical protein HUO14_11580 [Parasphingorhabdus flavimaris]|jgi:phage-related tail protein|uniref:Uncharacterized protein n=1 Tax=Parasphingorhabdus flavimaris TaxID=266812 RepID=A0ABX2N4D6_9SPHN|nr:hypothetical protein [Parasphingorhabdus flavimaris]NVD28544.1 hypothetical protein [Parasphingorhabdus flavimaris]|tara:strand:- start:7145 stop:7513 length:369 start_codon:yes stop_codon:yes gene_type:complete
MLNQRIEAARPIAKKINEVEKSLNLTMIQMGELMSSIAAARMAPGTRFSLTAGMDASEKLIAAAARTARSYREVVEAHGHLVEDRDDAGLRTIGLGDVGKCPPNQASAADEKLSPLRVVESA